jgi:Domain of unknown function (DUF4159)
LPVSSNRDNLDFMGRRSTVAVALFVATLAVAAAVEAQRYFREGSFAARWAPAQMPDASFVICRLAYRSVRMEYSGIGWQTDYPYAEINLTTRLSELTRTRVSRDESQQPNFYVVRLTDDALFNCPITVASDAGTIGIREDEAERLRTYLLKGGFLWADDFWGSAAWDHWEAQIARVLPPSEYPIEDVDMSDPLLHSLFEVKEIPQITNIQFWRRSGGQETSERGADSEDVHFRVIRDKHRRVMVLMTHNTDVADSWEREGEDPAFFYQFSPAGYALGIDVLIHALTH